MRLKNIILTGLLALLYIALRSDIDGPAHHGHGDLTGAPSAAVGRCQVGSCHGGNNPLTIVKLQVIDTSTMLPITVYNAMQTYQVTITGDATGVATSLPSFGFQTSAVLNNHKLAGSYTIPAAQAGNIHSYPCGATTVVEQSVRLAQDTAGVNKYSISFYWTAPTYLSDTVTFYTLLNAVDGDGGDHGDYPNTAPNVVLTENPADSVYEAIPAVNAHYDKFIVFPNPTAGNPTVFYNLYAPELVSLTVCDVAGRTVLQVADNEYQFPGEYTYHPTIKTPGVYFIKLVTNGTSQSLKFIKQ